MAEFYVTYDDPGGKCLAIVVAPRAPANWQFANRGELIATMNALDHEWQLLSEMPVPEHFRFDSQWPLVREKLAEMRATRDLPKPDKNLASQGNINGGVADGDGAM